MFMRRVARPVTAGCVDLHNDQAVAGKSRRDNAVDLAGRVIASADLNRHFARRDQAWLMILLGRNQSDGILARAFREDSQGCLPGEIERGRQAMKNALPLSDMLPLAAI